MKNQKLLGGNKRLDPRLRAEIVSLIRKDGRHAVNHHVRELFIQMQGTCPLKSAAVHVDRAIGVDTNLFRPATIAVFEALVGRRANAAFHERAAESDRVEFDARPIPPSGDQRDRHDPGTAMVPVRFDGDLLEAVRKDQTVYVSVKRVCESLGITEQGQISKLKECGWAGTTIIVAPSNGGNQQTFCIDLKSLPMWLAGIHASKVDEAVRPKLLVYQLECRDALARHFGLTDEPKQLIHHSSDPVLGQILAQNSQMLGVLMQLVSSRRRRREPSENTQQEPLRYEPKVVSFSNEQCIAAVKKLVVQKAVSETPGVTGDALGTIIESNYSPIYARLLELTGINARTQSVLAGEKSHIEWCRKSGLGAKLWEICHELWADKSKGT